MNCARGMLRVEISEALMEVDQCWEVLAIFAEVYPLSLMQADTDMVTGVDEGVEQDEEGGNNDDGGGDGGVMSCWCPKG